MRYYSIHCHRRLLIVIAALGSALFLLTYQHLCSTEGRWRLQNSRAWSSRSTDVSHWASASSSKTTAQRAFPARIERGSTAPARNARAKATTETKIGVSRSTKAKATIAKTTQQSLRKNTKKKEAAINRGVPQHYGTVRPIDAAFIDSHFTDLKAIFRKLRRLSRYWNDADKMMKHRRPVINSKSWRLHSPSGYNYSQAELLKLGNDGRAVPNVAHFVLPFGDSELKFHHRVCILSCVWIMRPRLLFLWYSKPPTGSHWKALQRNLSESGVWDSRVVLCHRDIPSKIYGLSVKKSEHKSDLMRLEAVIQFGGAYFDLDVITLKSLSPLRGFNFTIGRQSVDGLCNGVFLAAPNSTFLVLWHLAYQMFDGTRWATMSVSLPHRMCASGAFRQLCHVEEDSMDQPTWNKHSLIYKKPRKWPWRQKNYVMHLWYRFHSVQYNMSSIRTVDSMLGDMFRYVLFGNATLSRRSKADCDGQTHWLS